MEHDLKKGKGRKEGKGEEKKEKEKKEKKEGKREGTYSHSVMDVCTVHGPYRQTRQTTYGNKKILVFLVCTYVFLIPTCGTDGHMISSYGARLEKKEKKEKKEGKRRGTYSHSVMHVCTRAVQAN